MKWKPILGLMLLATLLAGPTQAERPVVRVGDWYYKQFDFIKAIAFYQRALKKDSGDLHVLQRIADSYRLINDWADAEKYYAQLAQKQNADIIDKLYYADALRANQKYAEAKVNYKAYLDVAPADNSVKERMEGLDKIEELSKDKGFYEIQNLKTNTKYSDFGVSLYKDTGIFFCSNRYQESYVIHKDDWTHASFLKIYQGYKDSTGMVSECRLLKGKEPNRRFHEGTTSYNDKMQELYYDRSNFNGRRAFFAADKTVKLKIYKVAWLEDQQRWDDESTEAVPFNDKEYSVGHPSVTKDGKTLFFASDKPGGYGGVDIYMSTRDIGGPWGIPVNLGPKVNTSGDDMYPFIADDGTLYFASDGHQGLGGLDIYSATPVKTNGKITGWTEPENLGYPVNTNSDDFNYVIGSDNKRGYFSSNRPGGQGDDDIYTFLKKGVIVNGIVYDAASGAMIEKAEVLMKQEDQVIDSMMSGKNGDFNFTANVGKKYTFAATKEGYLPNQVTEDIKGQPDLIKIPLTPIGGITLEVTVIDKKTRDPLEGAKIKITNLATGKDSSCTANKDGKCFFTLEKETNYRIEGSKETGDPETKYLSVTTTQSTIGVTPPKTLYTTLELEKVKKGVAIKIENIYYDLDKWYIRPDAAKELDKLVKIMKDNPTLEIELSSHTDCRGTAQYNQQLSSKRAESAVAYIASQGVDMKRMIAAGYGKTRPVNKCICDGKITCTEEEYQENRRTEFKILKF